MQQLTNASVARETSAASGAHATLSPTAATPTRSSAMIVTTSPQRSKPQVRSTSAVSSPTLGFVQDISSPTNKHLSFQTSGSPGASGSTGTVSSEETQRADILQMIYKPSQILKGLYNSHNMDLAIMTEVREILGEDWAVKCKDGDMNKVCTVDQHKRLAKIATRLCLDLSEGKGGCPGSAATQPNSAASLVREYTYNSCGHVPDKF